MATSFVFNNREHKFLLKDWLDSEKIFNYDKYKGIYDMEDVDMLLDVALTIAEEVVAPTSDDCETHPMKLKDGNVPVPDSFRSAYKFIVCVLSF